MTEYMIQAVIYLAAAVIAVPLAKRAGVGSVLGYLIAGVIIGPVFGLVGSETTTIQHFAEFGVVMMLFLVGLELEPKMLWNMRVKLLGLGGLQVALTTAIAAGLAMVIDLPWSYSLTIGMIFSLSSTAIVLQTFNEKGLTKTEGGNSAFSVLLFQDIAVIPMLALIPLLAVPELVAEINQGGEHHDEMSLVKGLSGGVYATVVLAAIAGVVGGGYFLFPRLFNMIAKTGLREMFTATSLMLVIGIAALMTLVGLSPALGAFLAGVVLANSVFRHQLESDIEPFKGLLLGLFFITVGAGLKFDVISANLLIVIGLTVGVMLLKFLVLFALSKLFKLRGSNQWLFMLSLAQAGEFGFVLLSYSLGNGVLPRGIAEILSPVVALTMFLTPLLFILFDKVIVPHYLKRAKSQAPVESKIEAEGRVIIAGVGRFGQIIMRFLQMNGYKSTVLDTSPSQIENLSRIGMKAYYGDATNPDLLHSAGIETAKILVIALDDKEDVVTLVQHAKEMHPHIQIIARSYDRINAFELRAAGADIIIQETYLSSMSAGVEALKMLGVHPFEAEILQQHFADIDGKNNATLFDAWKQAQTNDDESERLSALINAFKELESSIESEIKAMQNVLQGGESRGKDSWQPPPKNYLDGVVKHK